MTILNGIIKETTTTTTGCSEEDVKDVRPKLNNLFGLGQLIFGELMVTKCANSAARGRP